MFFVLVNPRPIQCGLGLGIRPLHSCFILGRGLYDHACFISAKRQLILLKHQVGMVYPSKLRLALWNGRATSVTDIFCVSRQQRYAWYIRSKKKSSLAAFWISCQWKEEQLHCEDRQPTICGKANSWKVSHKFEKPPPNSTPQGVRSASWKKRKLKRRPKWKWSGKGAEKECERKQGSLKASHQLTLAKSLKSWQTYEKSSWRHAWSKKTLWPIFSQEKTMAGAVWHLLCKEWHWLTQELTSERLWMKC